MHTSWVIYFSNNFYGSEKEKNATAIGRFDYSFMVKNYFSFGKLAAIAWKPKISSYLVVHYDQRMMS